MSGELDALIAALRPAAGRWLSQPMCAACWDARNPGRVPVALRDPERHRCAFCGNDTQHGIFVRGRVIVAGSEVTECPG